MGTTLGISKIYLKHFVKNNQSRWVILQGSRRSGKSFAVLRWLWFLASGQPKTVGVVCASFPALQNCISDFQRATGLQVTGSAVYGYSCQLTNGSKFLFRSFDDPTKAQGTTFNIVYFEEVLNIPEEIVRVISMSVTDQIFAAYNPTKSSFLDAYILPDKSNYLKTTYRDNPWLTPEQVQEFEDIKKRALSPTASLFDIYAAKVYCEGDFSDMGGKVFPLLYTCTEEEYAKLPARELKSLDFGFVESRDQTAMSGIKVFNNCLYAKEYIYDNVELQRDKNLAFRLAELGINEYEPIACDMAGLGKTRIHNLITAGDGEWVEAGINHGFYCFNAVKGKILDGLKKMTNYEKIYIVETSINLRNEMAKYEIDPSGKPKEKYAQHLVDSVRYAVNTYNLML